ncbi:MAG: hypothetical protein Q9160_003794 [Pyrenula sp. 1 TL-2023]
MPGAILQNDTVFSSPDRILKKRKRNDEAQDVFDRDERPPSLRQRSRSSPSDFVHLPAAETVPFNVLKDVALYQTCQYIPKPAAKRIHLEPARVVAIPTPDDLPESTGSPIPETSYKSQMSNLLLRPCHICHRRPTTTNVLNAYCDCDLCGRRVCYICTRHCASITCGHPSDNLGRVGMVTDSEDCSMLERRKFCSACILESFDEEGRDSVYCLGCVEWEGIWTTCGDAEQLQNNFDRLKS